VNLATLTAIVKQVDERTYLDRFPHPMLVVRKGASDSPVPFKTELDWKVVTKVSPFATSTGLPRGPKLVIASIEPLVKTTRNPFAGMITVGRATNNDVCLAVGSVSKLHAYFQNVGPKWSIRDGTSSNGTFVNGRKLEPNTAVELEDGAHLAFGPDTECLFKLPKGLYQFLQQQK
jgi:pSer/pThr/pTyr-binding forkhead associated (FHA) protein